ncbi:unnamed protein product, partial [Symbiodinium sp. KB8]
MPPHMVFPYSWQLRGSLAALSVPVLLLISSVEGAEVRATAGIEVVNGLEIHAGHAAHHMTALTHRLRKGAARRHGERSRASLEVDALGKTSGYQLTTPLE